MHFNLKLNMHWEQLLIKNKCDPVDHFCHSYNRTGTPVENPMKSAEMWNPHSTPHELAASRRQE